jgi:hypothetical protein
MTQAFQKAWLNVTAFVIAVAAPIFFLGTIEATREPARLTLDILSWPIDGATTYTHPDTHFLSALAGGFLLGWGVMIWALRAWVYDAAPEGVRRTVLASVLAWFVLDSAGSIASGNAPNAAFNVVFLVIAVGPLWRPGRG